MAKSFCLSVGLFVCSSVSRLKRSRGAVDAATAERPLRMSQTFPPREKLHRRESCASGGGLLVASMNAPH